MHIENTLYRMLHKKKNIDATLAEHPKFKNKKIFVRGILATSIKWRSTSKIQDSMVHQKFPEIFFFHLESE